jgi:hypothetical protein
MTESEDTVNVECDCCLDGITPTCITFFFAYILLFVVTVVVLINYQNVRKRSRQPAVMRNTSKFWVVIGVICLQLFRVVYFSPVWF